MYTLPEHTKIFFPHIPDFLYPFFDAPSIKRLHGVGQHCGTEYTKFFDYKFHPSRFDHSLGVALIIWHFTKDKKQTLAGFFHDISNTVFAHVGDFMSGDKIKQEATEAKTSSIIENDSIIQSELKKLQLSTKDVDDYGLYKIADNPGPQLSSDRLEYTLTGGYNLGHIDLEIFRKMYENIIILQNNKNEIELGFQDENIALLFGKLSIKNDQNCFSSYMSNISMSFLGEILKYMIHEGLLTQKELYEKEETDIIEIIKNSSDAHLIGAWNTFTELDTLTIHKERPKTDVFCIDSKNKKRYIDPLIGKNGKTQRLSEISNKFTSMIENHIHYPLEWITINAKI